MERILIKFTKTNGAKFISHLDMLRTLHRALRRSRVPIAYSKGFNPHASISVASPLSLGLSSIAEYVDIEIEAKVDTLEIIQGLNAELPKGVRVLDAISIKGKMPSAMGMVESARYIIDMQCNTTQETVESIIESILDKESIEVMKKTKSGEKMTNIRPLIDSIKLLEYGAEHVKIECMLLTGSRGSLNPDTVADLLKENSNNGINGYPLIERQEIYTVKEDKWVDLLSYYLGK